MLLISMDDGEVRELTPADSSLLSWKFLAADGNHQIVCARSSCTIPHEVVLGNIGDDLTVSWQVLSKPKLTSAVQEQLNHLEAFLIPIPDRRPVEIVLLRSKSAPASAPCICWPHGGPHSIHTTEFTAACVAFAVAGYTCSLVNYTGTPGFGETYIRKLLGRCGTLDVEDSFASANHLVDTGVSELGHGKQFVYGISHGGFLAAHFSGHVLSGRRNPVISCGEFSITDIPDWYFFEFGLPYNSRTIMTPETYATLFATSPIAHVDKVQAKVLLHLGAVDMRVAPTHAIMYYHALKGRGKTVEMLAFPKDSHSLGGVATARIRWESARDWFDLARE
ncbi:alpha/beta-hydrolase [Athelia psychrophila]|uniref:Dipeptidyl-peptidase V n=1 Tax=Athelia psychrophila TaxID=1759441 RepID=A0A166TPX7_9AGAM|nr:alpha/beta-hydrolase [Fibularhizoctonia sp. CBS 109695]